MVWCEVEDVVWCGEVWYCGEPAMCTVMLMMMSSHTPFAVALASTLLMTLTLHVSSYPTHGIWATAMWQLGTTAYPNAPHTTLNS